MAAFAKSIGNAVLNTRADQVVFADKETQADLFQTEKADSSKSSAGGRDTPITPKDFYWDQILFYLISAILGLSFLDLSVEFFRGSVIQCFIPDSVESRDQIAYLNNYCYGSLPNSQYYLIFILISAVIIIAPHYLWMSYFGAHFDFFFDLVKKLNRLRDTDTGEYSSYNFELVKKLEQKFSSSNPWIFRLYKLKLVTQLLFCLIVQAVNAFYFKETDFNESFSCPTHSTTVNSSVWPIATQVTCVYNSLTLLYFLRNTALVLISAAVIVIIIGLFWCYLRHTNELGAKDIAAFSDVSCLPPEEYPFPSARKVIRKILCCGKKERLLDEYRRVSSDENKTVEDKPICCPCFNGFWNGLVEAFCPRITTDLDFLVMRLFYADSGHGQVFKDIQIQKELDGKLSQDHELLYLLNSVHSHLVKKRINKKLAIRRRKLRGLPVPEDADEDSKFQRAGDLKKYFYESAGFDKTNPEETVYSYFQKKMGITLKDWSHSPFRSVLFGFLQFAPNNKLALDVSFGNRTGHSLVLARAFFHVVTVHFNKFYKNPKEICREENYQANFRTFTFQANIFSQNAHSITQSELLIVKLFNELGTEIRKLDLIVIGPITDRSKIVTTNLLIEKIYAREMYFNKDAILLAIRPLMIGAKSCTEHFIQYQPPEDMFEDINGEVIDKLAASNVPVYSVTPNGVVQKFKHPRQFYRQQSSIGSSNVQRRGTFTRLRSMIQKEEKPTPWGIAVECNAVQCIYEFKVFRYIEDKDLDDLPEDDKQSPPPEMENELPPPLPIELPNNESPLSADITTVPTGQLVSPLQSPSSLPNIPSQVYAAVDDVTHQSEPSLLDVTISNAV